MTQEMLTLKASDTAKRMWSTGSPALLTACTNNLNEGLWPDSRASELPAASDTATDQSQARSLHQASHSRYLSCCQGMHIHSKLLVKRPLLGRGSLSSPSMVMHNTKRADACQHSILQPNL